MTFQPRGWQVKALEAFRAYEGDLGALVVAATAAGKTAFALACAQDFLARGERVIMVAHRVELISQPMAALNKHFPGVKGGMVRGRRFNGCDAQIVFASKDTLLRPERMAQYLSYGRPALVIVDEMHVSVTPSFSKVLDQLRGPGVKFLGLTATPSRNDTLRLADQWEIIYAYGILDGIKDKVLVPPFAVHDPLPHLDLSDAPMVGHDYEPAELERRLLESHIVEHTVATLQKTHIAERLPFREEVGTFPPPKGGIGIFTVTVAQAEATSTALNTAGIKARVVCGETPDTIRSRLLDAFARGEVDCLVSPMALTVGTDLPRMKVVVWARPTRSHVLFIQGTGRGLRTFEDTDRALVIDLCGCTKEHSIVAAPVLVDGLDCPVSEDGQHRYLALEGTHEGRCQDCGQLIKCYKNRGGHLFEKKKRGAKEKTRSKLCLHCGSPQCPDSPDLGHHFIPWEDHKRVCIHCAMEIPDPMAAMLDRSPARKEPVLWKKLNVPGEVYAVDLGKVGVMFNVRREDGEFRPYLFSREKLTPLASGYVSAAMSRALTDDVARRTVKKNSYFGGKDNNAALRISLVRAEHLAKKLQLGGDA